MNKNKITIVTAIIFLTTACSLPTVSEIESTAVPSTIPAANGQTPGLVPQATNTKQTAVQPQPTQFSTPTASSSSNKQPTSPPQLSPISPSSPPSPLPAKGPSSITSSYVELYDYYSSNQGVDLDNGGGSDEMAYLAYKSSDPNPGHAIGQHGGGGTAWALMSFAPTYEDCRSINSWNPGIFISLGNYFCYRTDQGNYGYLRVDRLEQIGTGGGELQPWVLGISFTTWIE